MRPITAFRKMRILLKQSIRRLYYGEEEKLLLGRMISNQNKTRAVSSLKEVEFKVFSQWGDDGIIQFLVSKLDISNEFFIEIGVEDYRESNTRFLMMNNNWSGLVMDASKKNVENIRDSEYYWKYELTALQAFVDRDNINDLISAEGINGKIDLLHIDIDGNDYWIWDAIRAVDPTIVVTEYNSVFGPDRAITTPYQQDFRRNKAHYSKLYWGASLKALSILADKKGYGFVGCNSAGINAYFVKRKKLNKEIKEIFLETGFVRSKFRDSRDKKGSLTFLAGEDRLKAISGLPVYNVMASRMEVI